MRRARAAPAGCSDEPNEDDARPGQATLGRPVDAPHLDGIDSGPRAGRFAPPFQEGLNNDDGDNRYTTIVNYRVNELADRQFATKVPPRDAAHGK